MKKTLAVLAVLAAAAVAQADVLGSWSFLAGGESNTPDPYQVDGVTAVSFSSLTRVGGLSANATSAGSYNSKGWTLSSDNEQAGIKFSVTIASGFKVDQASLTADGINGGTTGPNKLEWKMNDNTIGTWDITSSKAAKTLAIDGTMNAGTYNFKEVMASDAKAISDGTSAVASGGPSRMSNLKFNGTVGTASAVPEPATMSLLGLGALAMALRRKLRK